MEDNKPKGFSKEIIIALVSIVGSIIVALISIYPNIARQEKEIDRLPTVDTVPKPIIIRDTTKLLSICDKYELAIKDVPLKFKNFKGDLIDDRKYDIIYQSKYVFENYNTRVEYDKDSKTYELAIYQYDDNDSIKAIEIFNRTLNMIDACIGTENKNTLDFERTEDRDSKAVQYVSEDYEIYVYMSTRDSNCHVSTTISKNSN